VCGSKKRKPRERKAEREEEEEVLGDVLSDPHHRNIDR
jgi:hypothetical protein